MKRQTITIAAVFFFLAVSTAFGMQGHSDGGDHGGKNAGHDASASGGHDMSGDASGHENMDHGGGTQSDGSFKHEMMANGVHAEFQVMSLKSMKMSDDQGNTHHIMVKMFTDGKQEQVKEAIGKIKVIAPDGKEQTATLKNYSGVLAANVTFPKPGKYGVICLTKVEGEKKIFKFWYPHK